MKKRKGEKKIMNCGMEAEIKEYRNSCDIDVEFEDGTVVTNKTYRNFVLGSINNRNVNTFEKRKKSCLGETRMMNCGMNATCIEYKNARDISVKFEDGTVLEHIYKCRFLRGSVLNPSINENRIKEKKMMNCGMNAIIIEYRSAIDVDVEFEDGTIVKNKTFNNFIEGCIGNPNVKRYNKELLGETRMMNCGMNATVVKRIANKRVLIRFEDGYERECSWGNFKKGLVANLNLGKGYAMKNNGNHKALKDRISEKNISNGGQEMTIIAYNSANDIDVAFEDGTIVKNKTYKSFKNGNIKKK